LAAIKEIRVAEERKQYNVDIDSLVNKPELGFHEALESPGEDAMLKVQPPVSPATDGSGEAEPSAENTGEETPEAGSAESLLQPPQVKKQRFPKPESLKTAENVVSLEKAEQKRSPEAPSPKPAAAKPSADNDRLRKLTIQIGSFQDENAAKRRVDELKTLGYAAYQSAGKIPRKGTWHRVRIGEFDSRDAAGPVLESLRKKKIKAIIVSLKK
jgi:cell division septation protein DedD